MSAWSSGIISDIGESLYFIFVHIYGELNACGFRLANLFDKVGRN